MVKNRPAPPRTHGATALLPALRARIARRELPPGAKLLENELSREFGVSHAKVRDAFAALAQRGLIQRIPNRGAVVAKFDLSQLFEIYDVREMLEGLCVRLAVKPALLNKTFARALNMLSHRVRFGYPTHRSSHRKLILMSELDVAKEKIAYLKVWLGILLWRSSSQR